MAAEAHRHGGAVDPDRPSDAPAGAVALITGSSSGIGAAVARELDRAGTRLVLNSSRSADAGAALAAELGDAAYVQGDVSVEADAGRLVQAAVDRWGRLDLVVNCAGTTTAIPHGDLDAVTAENWQRTLGVNLLGPWNVIRAAAPHLRASGSGAVVNVSSIAGLRPTGSSIPYAVSKAALNHLTLLLANALAPEIRVNAVAPGFVDTPWTADWQELRTEMEARSPLGGIATAEDVAEACLALARARHVTGQVLAVDGGLSLR